MFVIGLVFVIMSLSNVTPAGVGGGGGRELGIIVFPGAHSAVQTSRQNTANY